MAVIHDYVCMAHGAFENRTGRCPSGCSKSMVKMVFNQAPAVHTSGKTQFIDRKTQDLARQFGDTAMNDRFDSSRINMDNSGDIQKKRMNGQTYSLPVDPKNGVASTLGMTGGGADPAMAKTMQQFATQAVRSSTVVHDDHSSLPKE